MRPTPVWGYLRQVKFKWVAATLAVLLAVTVAPSASWASNIEAQPVSSSLANVVGLIVKYRPGVAPLGWDGQPTAAGSSGFEIASSRALGEGLFALDFRSPLTDARARAAKQALLSDERVLSVELDHRLRFGPEGQRAARPTTLSKLASFVAPSIRLTALAALAPTTLVAQNFFNPQTPRLPRIKLTWAASANLNGGTLLGYRIERSTNNLTWTTVISRTSSTSRTALISSGITPGAKAYFRVRAITKISGLTKVSLPSKSASATPVVAPLAPVLVSQNVVFAGERVTWQRQSLAQRGGESAKYRLTATSNSGKVFACTTTSNSCAPTGLVATVPYTVAVSVTNSVASASSLIVADRHYGSQWYLYDDYSVHADKAWQVTQGKPEVVVAVLDSGITEHPDLDGQVVPGYDFISSKTSARDGDGWDSDPTDEGDWTAQEDSSWHGTHVAGIIAAASNADGVVGVAPNVKIQPIRVLGAQGGSESDLIAAIHWAAGVSVPGVPDNPTPAKVINLSIGTESISGCDSGTQAAVRAAWDAGATPVTAAGNSSFAATYSYPGNCYPTINVGATGVTGDIAYYSNFGPGVDFSAPGGDSKLSNQAVNGSDGMMLSTWNLGTTSPGAADFGLEEGTSMAAPVVSGVLALIYSIRPDLSSDDVYQVLLQSVAGFKPQSQCALTAANYGSETLVAKCGAGIVDAGAAVSLAKTYVPKG